METSQTATVTQWRRWGKNRLYVHLDEETQIGWWDLQTGEAHPETPEHTDQLTAAVISWCAENGVDPSPPAAAETEPDLTGPSTKQTAAPPPVLAVPETRDAVTHPEVSDELDADEDDEDEAADDAESGTPAVANIEPPRPWSDLAANSAGESARFMASTRREAAPVKTLFARVLGVHTDERAWRIGADGEAKVAAQLAKLIRRDPRWWVLHAIPVGNRGADIDHLVVGPGGVFSINTKHHPKAKIWVGGNTFMVNGSKQPYIRNSRHEAKRVSEILSQTTGFPVHVHGVITTVNAGEFTVKSQPDGVSVVPRVQLTTWLSRHGEVLAEEQITGLFEVARRSTTWR